MNNRKQTPWLLIAMVVAGTCGAAWYISSSRKPSLMDSMQQPATGIDSCCQKALEAEDKTTSAQPKVDEATAKSPVFEITDPCCIDYVAQCAEPCVIKFYAPWCGACNHLASYYEEVAKEFTGKVTFYSINCDNQELMQKAKDVHLAKEDVQYLPTVVFLEKGKVHEQQTGAMPKDELISKVKTTFNV